jgi:hypothetical protein
MIAARTRAALDAKKRRQERAGTIRFGFQLAADGRTLEPAEPEQRALALLRECRAAGFSLKDTADELNRQQLRTRAGTPWRPQYVRALEMRHAS